MGGGGPGAIWRTKRCEAGWTFPQDGPFCGADLNRTRRQRFSAGLGEGCYPFRTMTLLPRCCFGFVFTCFAALSWYGCVSKPTMHLNHAEISGAQFATFPPSVGILMVVVVDVYNPNSY